MKKPWTTAIVAAALAFVFIGGSGTYARWNDSVAGQAVVITSGTLSASATGPVSGNVSAGTAPADVVMRSGSAGMIPGIQAQTLSYTITNSGSAGVPATLAVRLVTASVAAGYPTISPYLTATISIDGGAAFSVPAASITSTGIDYSYSPAPATTIAPGASRTIVFTFGIPATSGVTDLVRQLQASRSGTVSVSALFSPQPVFTLTQIPRAS